MPVDCRSIAGLAVAALISEINRTLPKVDITAEGVVTPAKGPGESPVPMELIGMEVILIAMFRHCLECVLRRDREPALGGLLRDPQEGKELPARIPDAHIAFTL